MKLDPPPVMNITCCICAATARGRQWFNRDSGFGICPSCAETQAKREQAKTMTNLYGIEGFHYAIKNEATTQRPLRAEHTGRRHTDKTS